MFTWQKQAQYENTFEYASLIMGKNIIQIKATLFRIELLLSSRTSTFISFTLHMIQFLHYPNSKLRFKLV